MKFATINSSDIFAYNRMDAKFFLALKEAEKTLIKVKEKYTKKTATDLLEKMPLTHLTDLLNLARSNTEGAISYSIKKAIEEYPLESLSLVLNSTAVISAIEEKQKELELKKEELSQTLKLLESASIIINEM